MVEYSLTPAGQLFIKPLEMLKAWGEENADVLKNLSRRRNNTVLPRKAK
jgi:DNA-binding HxlR family transcriptional regulator